MSKAEPHAEALGEIIGTCARFERINFCIMKCESDGEVFCEASIGTSDRADPAIGTFYEVPSRKEAERAVRERMEMLGLRQPYYSMPNVRYTTETSAGPDRLFTIRDATQTEAA